MTIPKGISVSLKVPCDEMTSQLVLLKAFQFRIMHDRVEFTMKSKKAFATLLKRG